MTTPTLPEYVAPYKPVPQITPFTYRDGVTMLKKLELLTKYINRTLIPFVNENMTELGDQFEEQVNILIDAVNAAIAEVINDSVDVQDPVVAGIFGNPASQTRIVTDALYASKTLVDQINAIITTGRLSQSSLDNAYGAKSAVDSLTTLVTTGRLSSVELDNRYANRATTESSISDLDTRLDSVEADVTVIEGAITGIEAEIDSLDNRFESSGIGRNVIATYFITENESMHLAVSENGNNFVDTGLKWGPGATSGATVRDPDIALDATGTSPYLVAYTRPTAAGGGAFGTTNTIGIATSANLDNFTEVATVVMPGGINRTWAPDIYIDDDNVPHIFVSLSSNAGGTFQIYELRATNAARTAWTAPVLVTGLGTNVIDATIVKDDAGVYHCFVKNETTKYIEHATSNVLTGPYTLVDTGNWQSIGNNVEGPNVIRREDGGWRMYYDSFNLNNNVLYVDGDENFDNWSAPVAIDIPARHISVLKVANNGSRRAYRPMLAQHLNATGSIVTSQTQQGSLDLIGDVYNGFTVGKTRISLVASNRPAQPGNIYYTTGTASGDQEHVFEFDRGQGLGTYVGFRIKQAGDDKAVAQFPNYSTAARPSAAAAGVGGTYFDTTLNRLITSNGATWYNQDGVAV